MNSSIKEIIAREALVAFCLAAISIALVWIAVPTGHHFEYFTTIGLKNPFPYFDNTISALLYGTGIRIAFIAYPLYFLVRVIFLAVRICKK